MTEPWDRSEGLPHELRATTKYGRWTRDKLMVLREIALRHGMSEMDFY